MNGRTLKNHTNSVVFAIIRGFLHLSALPQTPPKSRRRLEISLDHLRNLPLLVIRFSALTVTASFKAIHCGMALSWKD
jgi:ABC-type amino acid transport system permease subunit